MIGIEELEALHDVLLKARYAGTRSVEYDGKRVTYASDAEMATALAAGFTRSLLRPSQICGSDPIADARQP